MTRLVSALVVAVTMLVVATTPAVAASRTHLWTAMHTYAECRAASGAQFAGDISSSSVGGPVTFTTLMSNKASLTVRAGHGVHVVEWKTRRGHVERVFTFRYLRNVAARLRSACS